MQAVKGGMLLWAFLVAASTTSQASGSTMSDFINEHGGCSQWKRVLETQDQPRSRGFGSDDTYFGVRISSWSESDTRDLREAVRSCIDAANPQRPDFANMLKRQLDIQYFVPNASRSVSDRLAATQSRIAADQASVVRQKQDAIDQAARLEQERKEDEAAKLKQAGDAILADQEAKQAKKAENERISKSIKKAS